MKKYAFFMLALLMITSIAVAQTYSIIDNTPRRQADKIIKITTPTNAEEIVTLRRIGEQILQNKQIIKGILSQRDALVAQNLLLENKILAIKDKLRLDPNKVDPDPNAR